MNETERKLVTLLRRVQGDFLTGTPVYYGEYEFIELMLKLKICIVPPSTTVEKIYRVQIQISGIDFVEDEKIYLNEVNETFWALRLDTVTAWISRFIDADVMITNGEEYSK